MVQRALYLAGGGARGAFQAGALKAIGQILQVKTLPFEVLTGVSVGSINSVVLAENADDFPNALEKLETFWSEVQCQQIYKASNYELSKSVLRNLSTLIIKQRESGHLLDSAPLRQMLEDNIDYARIDNNIKEGYLKVFEVITACYETHQTISFYNHQDTEFVDWHYPRHSSQRTIIQTEHILASSALPLFFPTTSIDGLHYGDGSMGLVAPLRGPIRFNVDKIMILGTRELPENTPPIAETKQEIPFAHILGAMLSGIFLDNLDRDIEMVNRMNDIATLLSMWQKRRSPWRPIQTVHFRPSRSMTSVVEKHYTAMPALLRYLLHVLGGKKKSGDLLSFLLFEKEFTREIFDLGYKDTINNSTQVEQFFN